MTDLIEIKVIDRTNVSHTLELPTNIGLNLMEACKASELKVEGVCGGMAMCASCHCYVLSDQVSLDRNHVEQAMLDETNDVQNNSRLGCQIPITEALNGLVIQLAPEQTEDDEFDEW